VTDVFWDIAHFAVGFAVGLLLTAGYAAIMTALYLAYQILEWLTIHDTAHVDVMWYGAGFFAGNVSGALLAAGRRHSRQ
jgi:hypothetical protein